MTTLECQNLTKQYGRKTALRNVNLQLESGRIIGLLGPNGSGKTTLIKLANGLLTPTSGEIRIVGQKPGPVSKAIVAYLPDCNYLPQWMRSRDLISFFSDMYANFDPDKAREMLQRLNIDPMDKLNTMSKGTKEKVQLIMTMSRAAQLYLLDEPIGGVDPAARDYILDTILKNYQENATVVISTHLIADIERVLDEAIFIKQGEILRHFAVDTEREREGKTIDLLFREVFKC